MCKCKWTEAVIAIVVFVMALWPNLLGASVSKWIIVVAAIILFVHAIMRKGSCECCEKPEPKAKKKK
jgi:hypothetical protein